MKLCFIDVETTGLYHNSAIVQVAGIIRIKGKISRTFDIRMRPRPGDVITVNKDFNLGKKTVSQEEGFLEFKSILEEFVNPYDKEDKFHFVAYNAPFDTGHIRNWFKSFNNNYFGSYFFNPSICVMQIAAHKLMSKRIELENFKLMTVAKYFGIRIVESKLHDAVYDIMKTKDLYNRITRKTTRRWRKPTPSRSSMSPKVRYKKARKTGELKK